MDMTVTILPSGNTTQRELAALSRQVTDALRGLRAVEGVTPVRSMAPEGAKGVADEVGSFMLQIPAAAITGAFGVLQGLLARAPETPTKVKIGADGGVEIEFDPRRTTTAEMADLIAKLRPAHLAG
jgi:hypothetical protein